jgi:hypothetical protein
MVFDPSDYRPLDVEEMAAISGVSSPDEGDIQFSGTTGRSRTNNNPLNLEYRPGSYQDKYGAELEPQPRAGSRRRFAKFRSMQDGYNAGLDQIRLDQSSKRNHTLASFVEKFAPRHENPTDELIATYAKQVGARPDTPLSEIAPEKLIVPMLARESSTRIKRGGGVLGFLSEVLGPASAEAAEGPAVRPGFNPADYSVRPDFNPSDYSVQGAQAGTPAPLTRKEPGIYEEKRTLIESVKDYLGYRDLPAFLPAFNQETGLWQALDIYEARKLYHGWEEPTELERVLYRWVVTTTTLGAADWIAKDLTAPVPGPKTAVGAFASGALDFASFMVFPFKMAEGLLGTRLAPTRSGLRGLAQVMGQGGATLGLASAISGLLPSLAHNDRVSDAGLEFVKGTASGATIGALFPVAGLVPTKTLRMAVGLAGLDFVKTRFHEAPDKGLFTLDDVYRGVRDGTIDRTVLAQKTFDYLLDLYFLAKVPSMKQQLAGLKMNALMEEAGRVNPQEAEDALVEIGKSGVLQEQGSGVRGQGSGKEGVQAQEGPQAGTPAPLEDLGTPVKKPEPVAWKKPWELSGEEYGARVRALSSEDRPEPTPEKVAKLREADVRQALKRGEPVPPEVLADFPEMAGRVGKELPAAGGLEVKNIPTAAVKADPERFQYKLGADETTGAGLALGDVKTWDEGLSGVLTLWRSPEGELFVVNGHQRLALAQRTGTESVRAQVLDASGWSDVQARAYGARINIAEGRGTEIDAAKFMRDMGISPSDLAAQGVSLVEGKTRRAVALAQLSDPLFHFTATGDIPVRRAAIIGEELYGNHPAQDALFKTIRSLEKAGKVISDGKLRELILLGKAAGVVPGKQKNLFGETEIKKSLMLEVADLLENAKTQLRRDKNIFGMVDKESARLSRGKNIIDPETNKAISEEAAQAIDALNRFAYMGDSATRKIIDSFARKLSTSKKKSAIREESYEAIKTAISEDRTKFGLDAGTRPGAGGKEPAAGVRSLFGVEPGAATAAAGEVQAPPVTSALPPGVKEFQGKFGTARGEKPDVGISAPEAPDYAYIDKGDMVRDARNPEAFGAVVRESARGDQKGFIVERDGKDYFIPREEARLMGLEELEGTPAPPGKMYGGGPGLEEIQAYGKQLLALGNKMIDWVDARLDKNLPPELQNKDAGKIVGSLLLKFQQFEDIARTYPEAQATFEAARAGLALKTRHAAEFYSLTTPYLSRLKPGERARVDKALVDLDIINDPAMGENFRLGNDIDRWQSYLLNPREDIRDKGVAFYMGRGLNAVEAEGAFGVRMSLDYAKALHLDWHTRSFQEWLQSHGFDHGRIKDIMDWVLNTEMKPDEIAKAFFGAEPGKNVGHILENFRRSMSYWLKETHQYIPHSRFGEYFIRVIDTNQAAKAKEAYKKTLEAIGRRYPKDKVEVEALMQQASLEFMEGESPSPQPSPGRGEGARLSKADQLRAKARDKYQADMKATVIHAAAAESKAQYHDKRAALEAEFPAEAGYVIKQSLNKQLPMEIFSETHIPRVWRIVSEAAATGKMPEGSKEAMIEAWQDFLAAKGFGAHFIKRSNTPGYETDLKRPLTGYLAGLAGYIGKMEKIRGFSEAFQEVPKEMPNLLRHLNEYGNYVLSNPYEYEGIRNVIYNWTLGGNFSFHFINALQNMSTGWAVLGTAGPGPVKHLAGANKDWGRYMLTGEGLRPGEEALLHRARFEPELAPSGVAELSGQAYNPLYRWLHNDPTSLSAKAMDVFKGFWSGAFVEQLNRETFFLAALRTTGDYDQSVALVRQAHFLYGKETRPSVARGAGSIPAIFLTYTTNYFTLLKNFSKAALGVNPEIYGTQAQGAKGLARMFAGAMISGGLTASFIGPILKTAWEQVFGSNLEEDAKDFLQHTVGVSKGTAEFTERLFDRGLPAAALGIDIGSRIAPNLPMQRQLSEDLTWQNLVAGALGAGSIPLQVAFGVGKALHQGEPGKALEAGAPVSVGNVLKALRLGTEGATTFKGQPIFTDQGEPLVLDMGEAIRKAAGFQPIRLAEHQRKASFAREMEKDRRDKAQGFAGDLARAIRAGDDAGFNRTVEALTAYNNEMQKAGRLADIIDPKSVEQAVRSRFKSKYPDVSQKKMMLRRPQPETEEQEDQE